MRILFIKLKEIGDALILTPTIIATKQRYPKAEIWVVVRRGSEGILEGCLEIDHLITVSGVDKEKRGAHHHWPDLWAIARLRRQRFDFIFELSDGHRARLLAFLIPAVHRYSVKLSGKMKWWQKPSFTAISTFAWEPRHRVEKDYYSVAEFLPLPATPPSLSFNRKAIQDWPPAADLGDFCLLQIGSRKIANRWPRDRWKIVAEDLLNSLDHMVVSCGSDEEEVQDAKWLRRELGNRIVITEGRANWRQISGLLYRARLYIGLNTAAMHLAAACGCPIVALFGSTSEEHWKPWQATRYRIVAANNFDHLQDYQQRHHFTRSRRMLDIQPKEVIAACREMLQANSHTRGC